MPKVYLDELEEEGTKLVNYSKNDINEKINELAKATSNFVWNGPGYQAYITEYNSKIKMIQKINNNLTKIASYLIDAKEEYSDTNNQINSKYEELLDEYEELKNGL